MFMEINQFDWSIILYRSFIHTLLTRFIDIIFVFIQKAINLITAKQQRSLICFFLRFTFSSLFLRLTNEILLLLFFFLILCAIVGNI